MQKQKTIEEYRHDIQLLKHKINKIQSSNDELQSRERINENSDVLYVKPVSTQKRIKTLEYYFDELFKLTLYRGLTLEALFRCVEINNSVEIIVFQKFLTSFLQPTQSLDDAEKEAELNSEVQKMVAYIGSTLDTDFTGFIDRNNYISLLQIYGVESEQIDIIQKKVTLKGVISQTFQNVYEQSLDTIINMLSTIQIDQLIQQLNKAFNFSKTNAVYTIEQLQAFCLKTLQLNNIVSGSLFNFIDRYGSKQITQKQLQDSLNQITKQSFKLKEATLYLNLNCVVQYQDEMVEFRELLTNLNIDPIDIFVKSDTKACGRVRIGNLLMIIENEINFDYNKNKILRWLRLIDIQKTEYIDSLQFIYSLLSEKDVASFTSSVKQRAKIVKTQFIMNEIEIISLLGFRMKATNMKPSHWFSMMTKSTNQTSVTACQVRDSLYKLGFDVSSAVQLIRIIDTNQNFFVDFDEITLLFGSKLQIKETEDIQVSTRRLVDFLVEKYGSIDEGARKVFLKFDTYKTGILSREEFLYALDQIDDEVQLDENQKQIILEKADKNRDNQITLDEFKEWLTSQSDFGLPQKKIIVPVRLVKPSQQDIQKQLETFKPRAGILKLIKIDDKLIKAFSLYKLMQDLEAQNKPFEDFEFPANSKSLGQNPKKFDEQSELLWKRPIDFLNKNDPPQLYNGLIEPNDIKQGLLGDCYFLSSLSVLAERPLLISRIIESPEISKSGMYGVWLCLNGEWQCIYLDDQFPCQKSGDTYKTAFSMAHEAELWVLLLEKAYAKAYGSYEKIECGITGMAIRDLTGAPYFCLKIKGKDPRDVWDFVQNHKTFILTAGSQVEDHQKQSGIVSSHAYAILDLQSITLSYGSFNLIKLRNPWGDGEWIGKWSDNSKEWTEEAMSKLQHKKGNDGVFWMQIDDFVNLFEEVFASKLYEQHIYASVAIITKPNLWKGSIKLQTTSSNCQGFITISQIDARTFLNQDYDYSLVRCVFWKGKRDQKVTIITEAMGCERDLCFEINLTDKDEYNLYFEVDWASNKVSNFPFKLVVSSYSSCEIQFSEPEEVVSEQDQLQMISLLFTGLSTNRLELFRYPDNPLIVRSTGLLCSHVCFKYSNNSENGTLQENLQLLNVKSLRQLNMQEINKDNKISVGPKSTQALYFRVTAEGRGIYSYNASFNYNVTNTYTDQQLIEMAEAKPTRTKQREGLNGQALQVYVYDYMYDGGLAIVYRNKTQSVYKENLTLKLSNLKTKQSQYSIILKPNETFLIRASTIKLDGAISYEQQYIVMQ